MSAQLEEKKFDYQKKSIRDLRILFYEEGVTIPYYRLDRNMKPVLQEEIHYRMLYRTPGKAKLGSCMFIRDELYEKPRTF